MSGAQSSKAGEEIARLCRETGNDAVELTSAFGIPNHMVRVVVELFVGQKKKLKKEKKTRLQLLLIP